MLRSSTVFLLFCGLAGAMFSCQDAEPFVPPPVAGMVWIDPADSEFSGFYMDATEVTTAEFAEFVAATDFITEAEKFGWSGVFSKEEEAWLPVDSADWRFPKGPDSARALPQHPVTQVSLADAKAYAAWAGKRLPTEEEWQWAASQSGEYLEYPWGEEMVPDGKYPGNWWQGPFPYKDEVADGYPGIAEVKQFPPSANGLYDISGNVWEWTATVRSGTNESVIKGGSFLCSTSYCTGFNLRQKQFTPADSGLNHLGFRCVK